MSRRYSGAASALKADGMGLRGHVTAYLHDFSGIFWERFGAPLVQFAPFSPFFDFIFC